MEQVFDERLIGLVASGDGTAFRMVYEQTKSCVYGFALSILQNREDAEDVMHDTYIKLHQSAAAYQPMGRPLAWILTIVKHLAYNKLRARRPHESIDTAYDIADGSAVSQSDIETRMMLEGVMNGLDEREREIISLHALAGWKHKEISVFLDMPLSTVISKYHRGLAKMKQAMTGEEAAL